MRAVAGCRCMFHGLMAGLITISGKPKQATVRRQTGALLLLLICPIYRHHFFNTSKLNIVTSLNQLHQHLARPVHHPNTKTDWIWRHKHINT
ncbi:hypothetical protein F4801DRAFT_500913 [Xylaria longipes]|nr:hypothetical protein F4801DRAFT_500913 [Xylaria longipes]